MYVTALCRLYYTITMNIPLIHITFGIELWQINENSLTHTVVVYTYVCIVCLYVVEDPAVRDMQEGVRCCW